MSGRASGGGLVRHTQEDEGPLEGSEGLEIPSVRAAAMAGAVCPLIPVCPTPCIPSPVTSSSSKHEAQEREYFFLNDVHSFLLKDVIQLVSCGRLCGIDVREQVFSRSCPLISISELTTRTVSATRLEVFTCPERGPER